MRVSTIGDGGRAPRDVVALRQDTGALDARHGCHAIPMRHVADQGP
jgi:hypothetical protein